MEIYFLIIFLFVIVLLIGGERSKFCYYVFLLGLTFIAFFRDQSVGGDNQVYSLNYYAADMNPLTWSAYTEFEPGFAFYLAVFKTYICNDYHLFMGSCFIIYILGVHNMLKKERNCFLCLFFFVAFLYYVTSFNIMRQSAAMGVFLFFLPLLTKDQSLISDKKRKLRIIFYFIGVLFVTFFIHRSFVVMLILPFFIYYKNSKFLNDKKKIIFLIIFSYLGMFVSKALYGFIPVIANYLSFLGERYVSYANQTKDAEVTISYLASFFNSLFAIYVVILYPQKKLGDIYLLSYILSIILANFLGSLDGLFIRISSNLAFFQIFVYSYLWSNIKDKRSQMIFRFIVVVYGIVLFTNAIMKDFGLIVPYVNRLI